MFGLNLENLPVLNDLIRGKQKRHRPKREKTIEGYVRQAWPVPEHCAKEMRERAYQWKPSTVNKPAANPNSIRSTKAKHGCTSHQARLILEAAQ